MKKNDPSVRIRQKILAARKWRRELTHKEKILDCRRMEVGLPKLRKTVSAFLGPSETIFAPENFVLRETTDEALDFIATIREKILVERAKLLIDFSKCKKISPAAALLFAAEAQRCMLLEPGRLNGTYPEDQQVHAILQHFGVFRLLGVKELLKPLPRALSSQIIKVYSGSEGRVELVGALRRALLGSVSVKDVAATKRRVFRALSEAMLNTHHHAYELCLDPVRRLPGRWWMAGFRNSDSNEVYLMFLDQGDGIPATVRTKMESLFDVPVMRRLLGVRDGDMLKAAIQEGRTGTGKTGRGYGLGQMADLAALVTDGHFTLYSGRGMYTRDSRGQEEVRELRSSMGGTLAIWRLNFASP